MEIKKLEAAIEAVLFTMGESVELTQIASAIQQDKETTRKLLNNMMDRYQEEDRGIQIIELEQSYQMCTKKEYYECLIRLALHPKKPALTDVMLETLSIIAYKQPVTKAEIEKIRGVKCDHAINKLVEYELVKELGRLDAPGRPKSSCAVLAYRGWKNFRPWTRYVWKILRRKPRKKYSFAWMFRRKTKCRRPMHMTYLVKKFITNFRRRCRWSFREMLICTGSDFTDRISCFITC